MLLGIPSRITCQGLRYKVGTPRFSSSVCFEVQWRDTLRKSGLHQHMASIDCAVRTLIYVLEGAMATICYFIFGDCHECLAMFGVCLLVQDKFPANILV